MRAMSQSLATEGFSAAPEDSPTRRRLSRSLKRQAKLFAAVLLLHVVLLAGLVTADWVARPMTLVEEEIPVEVVTEQPPPPEAEQPPPQQAQEEQKPPEPQRQQEQIKQKLTLDEKPAFDAPRAENKEKVEREAPDEETRAQRQARPDEHTAEKPEERQQKPQQEMQQDPGEQQGASDPAEEDKRDAEVTQQAAARPTEKPEQKVGKPDPKAAIGPKQKSMSDLLASLEPTPHYRLGGAAKVAPVSGGTAAPTYFSVVLGYILRKFHPSGGRQDVGSIVFFVDPNGNLMHQALRKSSGSSARDQEALAALHRAQPFPPPPTGTSIGMVWNY
jgi:TonB family protein